MSRWCAASYVDGQLIAPCGWPRLADDLGQVAEFIEGAGASHDYFVLRVPDEVGDTPAKLRAAADVLRREAEQLHQRASEFQHRKLHDSIEKQLFVVHRSGFEKRHVVFVVPEAVLGDTIAGDHVALCGRRLYSNVVVDGPGSEATCRECLDRGAGLL